MVVERSSVIGLSKFPSALLIYSLLLLIHGACYTSWFSFPQNGDQKKRPGNETEKFAALRRQMVRDQLEGRDIRDPRVLAAMLKVPRHEFVADDLRESAYEDNALPLKIGQTISQPYIVAYMTQALELRGTERVLEIGTGSGYQAAVLAEIVPEVYTIEILPELTEQAKSVLGRLGYRNIHFRVGDGYEGWPEYAPFDRIIVTAAPEDVPQPLIDQLKEGGCMVIPVGMMDQSLLVVRKDKVGVTRHSTIAVRFVPMTGKVRRRD